MTDDIVARLRQQARNRYLHLADGELAARQTVEWKAADWFEARVRELEAEVSGVSAAIGTTRFMDPPDGGSVTLSEQVARMRQAIDAAEGRLSTIKAETIEQCANVAEEMPNMIAIGPKHVRGLRGSDVATTIRKLAQEVR